MGTWYLSLGNEGDISQQKEVASWALLCELKLEIVMNLQLY